MKLTTKQKQELKAKAHTMKPFLSIGQLGLTDAVKKEADQALYDHELIKLRINTDDRTVRKAFFSELCKALEAEEIQLIGHIGTIYRKSDKPK